VKILHSLLAIVAASSLGAGALAQSTPGAEPRVALKGYDPVAYFTEQRPVKGAAEFRQDFDGDRYHFASAKNRTAFNADPDRYAPQFAAMCAMGVSNGKRTEADPNVWKIVDGKLYVFSSTRALEAVEKDPSLLAKARKSWQSK
jgi:YHS domain-containing protein